MDLSGVHVTWGLCGDVEPGAPNATGKTNVGVQRGYKADTTLDILYAFEVEATLNYDVATLTLSTGVVSQTTGTPTITGGDGKDVHGQTLPVMASGTAIMVECENVSGDMVVTSSSGGNPDITVTTPSSVPVLWPLVTSGTIAFQQEFSGSKIKVTVLGKSS